MTRTRTLSLAAFGLLALAGCSSQDDAAQQARHDAAQAVRQASEARYEHDSLLVAGAVTVVVAALLLRGAERAKAPALALLAVLAGVFTVAAGKSAGYLAGPDVPSASTLGFTSHAQDGALGLVAAVLVALGAVGLGFLVRVTGRTGPVVAASVVGAAAVLYAFVASANDAGLLITGGLVVTLGTAVALVVAASTCASAPAAALTLAPPAGWVPPGPPRTAPWGVLPQQEPGQSIANASPEPARTTSSDLLEYDALPTPPSPRPRPVAAPSPRPRPTPRPRA